MPGQFGKQPAIGPYQGIFEESSEIKHRLGEKISFYDGREFVYSKNGSVALALARVIQAEVPEANHDELACIAAAVGVTSLTVTLGATAALENAYAEGFLVINESTTAARIGQIYKIKDHKAADASAELILNLFDPLRTAITTNEEATLMKFPTKDVIIHPSPNTAGIVGIPLIPVTALYYFWSQVRGVTSVLTDGTVVIGQHVRISDNVDGAVEPLDRDGTAEDELAVGQVLEVGADTEASIIGLNVPGF